MAAMRNAKPSNGTVIIDDGTAIHYQHYQQVGSETCVVLVHSLAMDHTFWRLVAPEIAGQVSVVCVDVRGHGQSTKSPGPYSIPLFAHDIKNVVQELGYKKVIIAGASLGGCITLQFGLDYPELTAGLALIDTTSWYGPSAPADWQTRAEKARTDGFASMVQFQTTRWFSDQFRADHPGLVQECVETFIANDVDAYVETCLAMGAFNASEQLSRLTAPTTIIVGSEDYAAPVEMSQRMHDAVASSTLEVIPGARHLTPLETPEVIIKALKQLLNSVNAHNA